MTSTTSSALEGPTLDEASAQRFQQDFEDVVENLGRVVLGKDEVLRLALVCLVSGGHLLFKDVPGTGKTLLARSIASSIQMRFRRLQFTPDLLPMDITGSNIFNLQEKTFSFQPGPVFTNLLLADELNRASPKTQSALLEAMAEGQVTAEGKTHLLDPPFLVIATMNPLDHAGTYPLPAAQLDRFSMQLAMGFPPPEAEMRMLDVHLEGLAAPAGVDAMIDLEEFREWQLAVGSVFLSASLREYLVSLANHMRGDDQVRTPPSPRAVLMLARCAQAQALSQGRPFVEPRDVRTVAPHVLAHRLMMESAATARAYVEEVLRRLPLPQ